MSWIHNTKALKRCLTDAEGIEVPRWGCAACPFSTPNADGDPPNPSDPDEGRYDCSLTDETGVWGEDPTCTQEDWAREIQRECEAAVPDIAVDAEIAKVLRSACWLVWSNYHSAWWGPNERGYFTDIGSAGRYTYEAAVACCNKRDKVGEGENAHEMVQPSPELDAAIRILCSKTVLANAVEKARGGPAPIPPRWYG